ncbi:hypothetical protein HanRHA438_Chr03g0105941 [Helianthus annuus]|uniref:Uncharacterized protein n=1 Tax=Helianthus annuus TaxID=4232 RepID=A0A251V6R2_HELAN|nr:uncharacterized protein LOC110931939 [Helianthus annuus]KAF5813144.1 hypothetical protein HanXRQr2_Chr03g0094791 [Helianthus annuus]KAJ0591950.1 hypothetical protein HanHA300_Chr03g0079221 [Helianthus annuus]KAJ0599322.1 hypothetical protein HanIR_Chr03g0103551 [Helianthus annuus]KAJ0606921.1 hypothetical protein HanHA89_Chr03g0090571 [Helianthus annuus]KAJ0766987.1 hypothetical protein HanLR1_Chr03g0083891 [Helianthus annuus]
MESTIIPQPQSSLGFFGIIRESFKTTSRNGKILVTILLFVFLSFSQLDFAQEYILAPVINDVVLQLAKHPNMVHDLTNRFDQTTYVGAFNDLREILLVKLLSMAVSSLIMLFFLIATVSSSSEAYTAKVLGPKDIFLKIKKSWKKPIVTSFYMILLTLGIALFYTLSIGITSILVVNSWAVWFIGAITLSIPACYFYVATLWLVSLIVSVLEDGSNGLEAIGRASELMKGKRLQASLMMVLFAIAYGLIVMMANFLTISNRSMTAELAITIPFRNGFYSLLKLFMFVVYTVSYHEWKTSHEEKEGKGFYLPVATGDV